MPCSAGGEGRKPQWRCPPLTLPDAVEDDDNVNGDEDGTFSDRCISGSGVWAFCLGSFGRHLGSFREKGSLLDAPGLPLGPLWALGAYGPCVGAAADLRFS
jgi:hypothetical protein